METKQKPNILIFMTDQQRWDTVHPFSRAVTPNLDWLAQEGISFTSAYCPAPHCCPSRATFFTGLYPTEHGVWNNVDVGNALSHGLYDGIHLWSDELKENGYQIQYSGKWHISAEETPVNRGWEMEYPKPVKTLPEGFKANSKPDILERKTWTRYMKAAAETVCEDRDEGEILRPGYFRYKLYGDCEKPGNDREVVDDALRIIRSRSTSDMPWCQFIGAIGPHDPYLVPKKYLDLYRLEDIQLPESFTDKMIDKPNLYRKTRSKFDQLSEREQREALRHYLAYCSYEDALFGEVIEALQGKNELENTLILYLSDHGDYAGDHGLWCKGLPCFEGAYHIPTVVRWPAGIKNPGRCVDSFVSLADFAPTFLEIAGIESACKFTGMSLVPFLKDEHPSVWRDAMFTQSNGNELYGIQRSVTTREWKYVYNGFDFDELYHLTEDPHEMNNLASNPEYRGVIRRLYERLWRFAFNHGDVCINGYVMVALADYGPGIIFEGRNLSSIDDVCIPDGWFDL